MSDFIPNIADAGSNNEIATANTVNIHSAGSANFNIETSILSYTVSAGQTLNIDSVELWGDYFGEWFIRINGSQKGGTNLSAAERSKNLDYQDAPIVANEGDVVTISVQHQYMGLVGFHVNLMGRIS